MKNLKFIESVVPMPLMKLPVRTVIAKTSKGEVIISPGSRVTEAQYDKSWNVTDIVAPNTFHSGGVQKAASIYPKANLWGAPGLEKKCKKIAWSGILSESTWPHQSELPMLLIEGIPKINECVFYSPENKCIIVTDLCFNLLDQKGLGAKIILGMFGTYNKFGVSRLLKKFITDRAAFDKSINKLLKLDFDAIIVSHGTNVLKNGKQLLAEKLKF